MTVATRSSRFVADVKCYFCGHVSGQMVGRRHQPLSVSNFVPRPGYKGRTPKPGVRLRCERCQGPVFLEDVTGASSLSRSSLGAGVKKTGDEAAA